MDEYVYGFVPKGLRLAILAEYFWFYTANRIARLLFLCLSLSLSLSPHQERKHALGTSARSVWERAGEIEIATGKRV